MKEKTFQEKQWATGFGDDYLSRNPKTTEEMNDLYLNNFGLTRNSLNKDFLDSLDRNIKILEVGCNVGVQLMILKEMGFKNLYGIEINPKTATTAKEKNPDFNITTASALEIPFKDNYFDLVFTSGVLIHIGQEDIKKVLLEIYRCSKQYIWGCEFYNKDYVEVVYRGNKNLLNKGDFAKMYLDQFPDLRLIKSKQFKYLQNDNVDTMFLLKK